MKRLNGFLFELVFWLGAIVALATSDLSVIHYTFCPLANLGITWCPGCGIGHSISAFLHGNIVESLRAHWFGIPATILIFRRIIMLISKIFTNNYLIITGGN